MFNLPKLPFYNKIKPVVLNAYTDSEVIHALTPLTMTSKCPYKPYNPDPNPRVRETGSFKTCYGNVSSNNRSITMPMWGENLVRVENGELQILESMRSIYPIVSHDDPDYIPTHKSLRILKFTSPWGIHCEEPVHFVAANHVRNTTPLNVPSGVLEFTYQHDFNIFFKLDVGADQEFKIPHAHPLLQLWPLTDRPIKLNCQFNPDMYHAFKDRGKASPYLRVNNLKQSKKMDNYPKKLPPLKFKK